MVPADDLEVHLIEPRPLYRLFRYDGAEWDPPAPQYRKMRVDPPDGHKSAFAVLYTAETIETVAVECRVLTYDSDADIWRWSRKDASTRKVARYSFQKPALFIPIDGNNRTKLGLKGWRQEGYSRSQELALDLYKRFGHAIHGLSWESFHRDQPGRVYALWHDHKDAIGLKIEGAVSETLVDAPEWIAFLKENPQIQEYE